MTQVLDRPKMKFHLRIGAAILDNPDKDAPLHRRTIRVEQGAVVESDVDLVARFGEKFERVPDEDFPRSRTPAEWTDEELARWGLTRASGPVQQVTINPVAQAAREGFDPATSNVTNPAPTKLPPSKGAVKDSFEVMSEKELREWAKSEGIDISAATKLAKEGKTPPEKSEKYHIVRILQAACKEE